MNHLTGSIVGKITQRFALTLTDQPNHVMSMGEVHGPQRSSDPLWNNSTITYWGITDLVNGRGTQHGYFDNDHGEAGHDWGTFVGKVTTVGGRMTVEGRFEFAGGNGKYRGITGGGMFKTVMKSETELECAWDAKYALAAKSKAA